MFVISLLPSSFSQLETVCYKVVVNIYEYYSLSKITEKHIDLIQISLALHV